MLTWEIEGETFFIENFCILDRYKKIKKIKSTQ